MVGHAIPFDLPDPTLSSDGLELFGGDGGGLVYSRRATTNTPFARPEPFLYDDLTPEVDFDPALSNDGLTLVFTSQGGRIYELTRLGVASDWMTSRQVSSANASLGLDLSADGLEVFVASTQLAVHRRGVRTDLFGPADTVSFIVPEFPSVSADGLTVYFHTSDQDVMTMTRATPDEDFADPANLLINEQALHGYDVDISFDGLRLLYRSLLSDGGHALRLLERTCM